MPTGKAPAGLGFLKQGGEQAALGLGVPGPARLAQATRGQDPQHLGVLHLTQPAHEGGGQAPQEGELVRDLGLAAAEGRRHLGGALGLEVAGVEQIGPPNGILGQVGFPWDRWDAEALKAPLAARSSGDPDPATEAERR